MRVGMAVLAALVSCLEPASALAQPETEMQVQDRLSQPNYARGGYYIGVEGLVAIENSDRIPERPEFDPTDPNGPDPRAFLPDTTAFSGGAQVRLGLRHNRWFATEIQGIYVHNFGSSRFLAWGLSANERFYLTKGRVQPFLTVGVGFLQTESRNVTVGDRGGLEVTPGFSPGFAPLFGGGLEIYWTENFAVTLMANYHLTVGNISGLDFMTAGVGLLFF